MKKILLGLVILFFANCDYKNSNPNEKINSITTKFNWNFSVQKKFIYSFTLSIKGENKMAKDKLINKTYTTGRGLLIIDVKENNLADFIMKDIVMKRVKYNPKGNPLDTITQKVPTKVVQGMKPDGSLVLSNNDMLYGLLFPIPTKKIEIGESNKVPLNMPLNANGSNLYSKGQNTLTLKGYEEINGRKCAVVEGFIDISKLDVPEELIGEYKCSTIGTAIYYFDTKNGYYVGSDVKVAMVALVDSETDDADNLGMYALMKSENVYKIRLEKIEE